MGLPRFPIPDSILDETNRRMFRASGDGDLCMCDGDLCIRTHAGLCHGLMTESCRVHQIRFREGGHGICSREHVWRAGGVPSRGLAREAKIRSHSGRAAKAPTMPPLSCGYRRRLPEPGPGPRHAPAEAASIPLWLVAECGRGSWKTETGEQVAAAIEGLGLG